MVELESPGMTLREEVMRLALVALMATMPDVTAAAIRAAEKEARWKR